MVVVERLTGIVVVVEAVADEQLLRVLGVGGLLGVGKAWVEI